MSVSSVSEFGSADLKPWLIVLHSGDQRSLALWQLEKGGDPSLAIFSTRLRGEEYADRHCGDPWEIRQFEQIPLIKVMAACFRQGVRFAILDPGQSEARQVFQLREVLKAAKAQLQSGEIREPPVA